MAAWTEAQRAKIRHYLGVPPLFASADPRMESAMTAVLAETDGGSRPDNSTQLLILSWIAEIEDLEARMKGLRSQLAALQLATLQIDPIRALFAMRSEARRFVHSIAAALGTYPRRDVFGASELAGGMPLKPCP